MEQGTPKYETPEITEYGHLKDLTANDGVPQFVDVPQGTIVMGQPIVGSDPNPPPPMS